MVKYTENIIPRVQREAAVSVTAVSGPSAPGSRRSYMSELHSASEKSPPVINTTRPVGTGQTDDYLHLHGRWHLQQRSTVPVHGSVLTHEVVGLCAGITAYNFESHPDIKTDSLHDFIVKQTNRTRNKCIRNPQYTLYQTGIRIRTRLA